MNDIDSRLDDIDSRLDVIEYQLRKLNTQLSLRASLLGGKIGDVVTMIHTEFKELKEALLNEHPKAD